MGRRSLHHVVRRVPPHGEARLERVQRGGRLRRHQRQPAPIQMHRREAAAVVAAAARERRHAAVRHHRARREEAPSHPARKGAATRRPNRRLRGQRRRKLAARRRRSKEAGAPAQNPPVRPAISRPRCARAHGRGRRHLLVQARRHRDQARRHRVQERRHHDQEREARASLEGKVGRVRPPQLRLPRRFHRGSPSCCTSGTSSHWLV